jgi:HK97 family phage portal protein
MAKNELKMVWNTPSWMNDLTAGDKLIAPWDAYNKVPLVHRCITMNANAAAQIPYRLYKDKQVLQWDKVFKPPLRPLIRQTVLDLLVGGDAFWLKLMKGKRLIGVQRMNPLRMTKSPTSIDTLTTGEKIPHMLYTWTYYSSPGTYDDTQVIRFKEYNPNDDLVVSISDTGAVYQAAQILYYLDRFAWHYFEGGAMPVTMVSIEGGASKEELNRIQQFFQNMWGGVTNMGKTIAVSKEVKVNNMTPDLSNLAMQELTDKCFSAIANGFGIPKSMLSEHVNRATAIADRRTYYDETILPLANFIVDVVNSELLADVGMRLMPDISDMDVYQQDIVGQSAAYFNLLETGVPAEIAVRLVGMRLPEGITIQDFKDTEPTPQDNAGTYPNSAFGGHPRTQKSLVEEIKRWEKFSIKRLDNKTKRQFTSTIIPQEMFTDYGDKITEATTEDEIKAVFEEIKCQNSE